MTTYKLTVNGRTEVVDVPAMTPLLDVLREHLGLRGSKVGCREGRCGACTVEIGSRAVASCLIPVALATGQEVTTIEGVAEPDGTLHPVQEAMLSCFGVQCGACTPGVVMSLRALLTDNAAATDDEIRQAVAGNICRCTGYRGIIDAAKRAAGQMIGSESR